jgi:enoyl-CoA hydratase
MTDLIESALDQALLLTVNRPDKLNALNSALLVELRERIEGFARQPAATRPRAVVLTGAGDKAFVAGADIGELAGLGAPEARELSEVGHRLGRAIEEAPFPVIAAVNGFALGGGLELALCADFVYASERAKFGLPEVGLGLIPGFGGTQRLRRRIGAARARELIYTGRVIDATEALTLGLVNRVLPPQDLLTKVAETCASIAAKGPLAIAAAKRVVLRGEDVDLGSGCELEAAAFGNLFATADAREGTSAFLEKRKPVFGAR